MYLHSAHGCLSFIILLKVNIFFLRSDITGMKYPQDLYCLAFDHDVPGQMQLCLGIGFASLDSVSIFLLGNLPLLPSSVYSLLSFCFTSSSLFIYSGFLAFLNDLLPGRKDWSWAWRRWLLKQLSWPLLSRNLSHGILSSKFLKRLMSGVVI